MSCSSDRCLPSRLPCQVHADCPEFFYCNDFTADEIPSHWPAGAGRACKPLLGHPVYAPDDLSGGTLVDDASAGGANTGGGSSPGGASTGGANTSGTSAGGANTGGASTGGASAGGTNTSGGTSTAGGTNASAEADREASDETSSCACRTGQRRTPPGWLGFLALALGASMLRLTRVRRAQRTN